MATSANKRLFGFTMVEMLAVIVIISILASASMIGLTKARVTAYRTRTRDTCRQVAEAWKLYLMDNHKFPAKEKLGAEGGALVMNLKTLKELNGFDYEKDATNSVSSSAYLEVNLEEIGVGQLKRSNKKGLVDKWGNYIYFNLDFDLVGEVDHPAPEMYGNRQDDYKKIKEHQVVWSKGDKPGNENKKGWIVIW